jgi:prolipoprotein diacylglyceryltransferase
MSSLVAPAVPGGTPIGGVGNAFATGVFGTDNVGVISLAQPINIEINNIRVRLISSFFIKYSPTNINESLF